VGIRACAVSFRGVSGIRHSVELEAETVYEAAIRGLHLLRKDGWVDNVGPGTELEIQVREPTTTHTVSVFQLRRWCDGVAASPAETLRKSKLKQLLG
jgi:hypothetical protein